MPRLISVVNILSHLGSTHPVQLEEAVQDLLAASPGPATVPFLLHLACLSSSVRRALVGELAPRLTLALPRLALALAAELLVRTDRGGPELLLLELGAHGEAEVG